MDIDSEIVSYLRSMPFHFEPKSLHETAICLGMDECEVLSVYYRALAKLESFFEPFDAQFVSIPEGIETECESDISSYEENEDIDDCTDDSRAFCSYYVTWYDENGVKSRLAYRKLSAW